MINKKHYLIHPLIGVLCKKKPKGLEVTQKYNEISCEDCKNELIELGRVDVALTPFEINCLVTGILVGVLWGIAVRCLWS